MRYVEFKFFEKLFKYKTNEEIKEIINKSQKNKNDLLFYFSIKRNIEVMRYLIEQQGANVNTKASAGDTILFNSCLNGNLELVEYLIEHGADIDVTDNDGENILIDACENGNLELVKYLVEEKKMDVNAKDKYGQTVLLFTCQCGNIDIVKYLVEHGADVNAKFNDGQTLLLWAKKYSFDKEIIDYLISVGAKE